MMYYLKIVFIFTVISLTGFIGVLLRVASFDLLLNFNRKYFFSATSKFLLWVLGIRLVLPSLESIPKGPCFYTFNHNSYLDGFALTALGVTDARFLLTTKMMHLIPVTLFSVSIGTQFIPPKENREKRLRFFKNIEKRILKEQISIFGSSEGVHKHAHSIAPFNRGVYHMATLCKMPVICLYIDIPEESNPFDEYRNIKSGTIRVELLGIESTENWTLDNLDEHVSKVRSKYVNRFNEINNENIS